MKKNKKIQPNDNNELVPHTSKSWIKALILGFFIGIAVIIPGVSGSTVAIILGMYTALLYAIGNIFNDFKRCFAFLFPVGIGAAVGFLSGFFVIQKFFSDYVFEIVCLFVGLMIGAIPAIFREIKGEKLTATRGILFPVGVLIPILVGIVSIILTTKGNITQNESFSSLTPMLFILYFPLGIAVSTTQIIPGLSATALLMACGQFKPLLNSLRLDYILENPLIIGLYASIGIGFLLGLVIISRLFSELIKIKKATTFYLVTGLSVGSIISMFINPDMWSVYTLWGNNEGNMTLSLTIGIILLLIGLTSSFYLTRYELRENN